MPDVAVLEVLLHGERIGTLTRVPGERTLFAFDEPYVENDQRATLSLSFQDELGELIEEFRPTRVRVPPFFENLLPEGPMRDYLAGRAGVNAKREFFLLWVLGRDLAGAVTVRPAGGNPWPGEETGSEPALERASRRALHFSLAGVQLKLSALMEASGGLTISATGAGGSWIVKLPSAMFKGVPENEYAMMTLARLTGIDASEVRLVATSDVSGIPEDLGVLKGKALVVRRFDRGPTGPLHIEDFAQVFEVYPEAKYKEASYANIAGVLGAEADMESVSEFVRRLVFSALIGNADMHLKNWSLIYPDRRRPRLAPAYDFVSTIARLPDPKAALNFSRTKRWDALTLDELEHLAKKARLPRRLVLDTASETVQRFHQVWRAERKNLSIPDSTVRAIEKHMRTVPLADT